MSDQRILLETGPGPGDASPGKGGHEALKRRSADALERGLAFVDAHGDALARLRARVALAAEPSARLVTVVAERQREDGSFPRLAPSLAEILGFEDPGRAAAGAAGGLEALALLAEAHALHVDAARRLEGFLRRAQNPDGSWGDPSTPSEARLHVTGVLAGLLGRTRFVRPELLERAGDFLAGLWSPDAVEGGRWSAISAFALFFTNVHHDLADAALQWCGRELERGFRTRRFDALQTAQVLLDCDAAALPGFGVEPAEVAERLVAEQASDGGFAELSGAGAAARAHATVEGLRAVVALNRAF